MHSAVPRTRFIQREVLERASRNLLVRFLTPHADALTPRGVALDVLAATVQDDYREVHRLDDALHAPAPTHVAPLPSPLVDALLALDGVATAAGRQSLLEADPTARLPRGRLGDEDLALVACLDHPDLFAVARRGQSGAKVVGFTVYEPADARRLEVAGKVHAIRDALGTWLETRDRTGLCQILPTDTEAETSLDIKHGRSPATRERIDPDTLGLSQRTDAWTQRAYAFIEKATGRLYVHASTAAIKDAIRRIIGEACAQDGGFFRTEAILDLEPFRALDEALSVAGLPALTGIEVREIELVGGGRAPFMLGGCGEDLREGFWAEELDAALARAQVQCVKLYVTLAGRTRPSMVKLKLPGVLTYVRDDVELDRAVTEYLVARGVLRLPVHATTERTLALDASFRPTGE